MREYSPERGGGLYPEKGGECDGLLRRARLTRFVVPGERSEELPCGLIAAANELREPLGPRHARLVKR